MGTFSVWHWLIVLVVVLVLFGGGGKIPKLMRDMGFNLLILHRDRDMEDFWSKDFSTIDMPQDYVERLAAAKELTLVTHLVASLQAKITWRGRSVLLVGYMREATQACVDMVALQSAASRTIAEVTGAQAGFVTAGAAAGAFLYERQSNHP